MNLQQTFQTSRVRSWTLLMGSVVLFLIIGLIIGSNQPKPYPDFVADSPAPTGVKAFYTYLHHHNGNVGIWKKQAQTLPGQTNQLMVMVQPYKPFDKAETANWQHWMAKGNTLFLAVDDPEGYFNLKSTVLPNLQVGSAPVKVAGERDLNGTYKAVVSTNARLKPSSGDQPLLKDQDGVLALAHSYGKGQLIVVLAPTWFTNDQILKNDNLQMILPLINQVNPKMIWVNDHIHGYGSGPTLLSVYPKWFLFLFGDLLLVLLLWLWYKGKRFGPVEVPREWVVRFGDERLLATAAWYRRGRFYIEAVDAQIQYLRSRMQEKWGIPMTVGVQDLLTSSERRLSKERFKIWQDQWPEIQKILEGRALTHKEFLTWSIRIDDMRKEVDEA